MKAKEKEKGDGTGQAGEASSTDSSGSVSERSGDSQADAEADALAAGLADDARDEADVAGDAGVYREPRPGDDDGVSGGVLQDDADWAQRTLGERLSAAGAAPPAVPAPVITLCLSQLLRIPVPLTQSRVP